MSLSAISFSFSKIKMIYQDLMLHEKSEQHTLVQHMQPKRSKLAQLNCEKKFCQHNSKMSPPRFNQAHSFINCTRKSQNSAPNYSESFYRLHLKLIFMLCRTFKGKSDSHTTMCAMTAGSLYSQTIKLYLFLSLHSCRNYQV